MKKHINLLLSTILMLTVFSVNAQTTVNTLTELRAAVVNSNQTIVMKPGTYKLEDLPSGSRVINCSGSNNTIVLTGVQINTLVGSINEVYFIISGNNNTLRNGAIADYYKNGLQEVTDFSAYNNDRTNLAYGLKGAPVMSITGNGNLVVGLKMTVKGSFPYGYGSQYGIGSTNTFGLNKRCGILITGSNGGGIGNSLDSITMFHHAFGHGIYMQTGATETSIKNTYIEGRMRLSDDMYKDTKTYDLPYQTDYKFPTGDGSWRLPFAESYDIPLGVMYPLSEDGIRSYSGTGSVTVENCTVKQMRGGFRLYLASNATVTNSTAVDCGETNYNMPSGGKIIGSSGNFSFAPLNDFRLSRSNQNVELTIIPSPHATGPHNLADILGSNHKIVFHRTPGPIDTKLRPIVVTDDNSTITNETEYPIILEATANGNTIISCGQVTDNGTNNKISKPATCPSASACNNTVSKIEAECYDNMLGITSETSSEGGQNIGNIHNGDWAVYNNIDLTNMNSVQLRVASKNTAGGTVEVRLSSITGTLIASVPVANTGDWQTYVTKEVNIKRVTGVQNIYLVFKGGAGGLMNINWFGFSDKVFCANTPALVEAECYTSMLGIQTENCSEGTLNVGYINNGDWLAFNGLNLTGMKSIKARVSGKTNGSTIEVRTGSITGTLIATIPVSNTGGHQTWVTDSVNLAAVTDTQNVFLVFKGAGAGYLFNLNWFGFSNKVNVVTGFEESNTTDQIEIYPNPFTDKFIIQTNSTSPSTIEVMNTLGQIVNSQSTQENSVEIDLSSVNSGLYFVKITNENQVITREIIKK